MDSKSGSAYPQVPSAPDMDHNYPAPPSYDQATGSSGPHIAPYIAPHVASPGGYQPLPLQQQQVPANAKYPVQQMPPGGVHIQMPPQTFVVQTPVGPHSSKVTCPSCQMQVKTRVSHDSTTRTHLMALLCCILCCPCTCLPYCMDSCKDTNHYCPNCRAFIGSYRDRI